MITNQSINKLKEKGFRITEARKEVLSIFEKCNQSLSLKQIENILYSQNSNVDKSTLYRVLRLLLDQHIIIHSNCTTDHTYKLLSTSQLNTVDLVCLVCGNAEIINISQDEVKKFESFKKIIYTNSYGICNKCEI
jgi:Fur family zinc uptake transcriptional regulator